MLPDPDASAHVSLSLAHSLLSASVVADMALSTHHWVKHRWSTLYARRHSMPGTPLQASAAPYGRVTLCSASTHLALATRLDSQIPRRISATPQPLFISLCCFPRPALPIMLVVVRIQPGTTTSQARPADRISTIEADFDQPLEHGPRLSPWSILSSSAGKNPTR